MTHTIDNARGEPVELEYATPDTTTGPHPVVVVFHGSGGLRRMPTAEDSARGLTCSPRLEAQFEHWRERLLALGFAVVMPDSFTPRGYCDDSDDPRRDTAFPPIPADEDGKGRRLVARVYDLAATMAFIASRDELDLDRVAWIGFSNGASTVAIGLHHVLRDVLAARRDANGLDFEYGVPLPLLPTFPWPRFGVAYYPGCGFDGLVTLSTDAEDVADFYYPGAPLAIEHASRDELVEHCAIAAGPGTREVQAMAYQMSHSVPDHFGVVVHPGADHGFDDGARCDDSGSDADVLACDRARDATLARLATLHP